MNSINFNQGCRKIFTFKSFLILITIIGVLSFSPETLFSQATPKIENKDTSKVVPKVLKQEEFMAPKTPMTELTPQTQMLEEFDAFKNPSILTQAVVLTVLSLFPFIIMILTSFLKIVIVLSLLRNALGVQQAPPNQIINGVAFMLSLFIMYPTAIKMYDVSRTAIYDSAIPASLIAPGSSTYILNIVNKSQEPLREFLVRNSSVTHRGMFYRISYRVIPEEYRPELKPTDFIIVVPAYITSQLKDAFEIGVLIYIPFFVIDLVTSNVLLAMGMMMLSPVTISMPLKLFLLVMLDGWTLLIDGLVNTFR